MRISSARPRRLRWRGSFGLFAGTHPLVSVRCRQGHGVVYGYLFFRGAEGNQAARVQWGALILTCETHQWHEALWGEWSVRVLGRWNFTRARERSLTVPLLLSPGRERSRRNGVGRTAFVEKGNPWAKAGKVYVLAVRTQSPVSAASAWATPRHATHSSCPSATYKGSLHELHSRSDIWNNTLRRFAQKFALSPGGRRRNRPLPVAGFNGGSIEQVELLASVLSLKEKILMKWLSGPTYIAVAPPPLAGSSAIGLCSYTKLTNQASVTE